MENFRIFYAGGNLFELNFDIAKTQLRFFVTRDELEKMIDKMNSKLKNYPKQ